MEVSAVVAVTGARRRSVQDDLDATLATKNRIARGSQFGALISITHSLTYLSLPHPRGVRWGEGGRGPLTPLRLTPFHSPWIYSLLFHNSL